MKFRFLLIGLLVVFSSVGSYAGEDYLRFNLKSIELLKNTWGGGNAKLKLFIISDNLDDGQSQLDINHKEFFSLGLNEELKLSGKAGLSVPVHNGSAVNIYILAVNEDEDSTLARLAIASIGRVSGSEAVKFYKGFGKKGFFKGLSKIIPITKLKGFIDFGVGEVTEITIEKLMKHLEDNKIGTIKLRIDPHAMPSNQYVKGNKTSEDGTLKISYTMEFSEENKESLISTSSTQSNATTKWITPTNSTCTNNGGEIFEGLCISPWKDAKNICSASGGELPSIETLKQVVMDCGGEMKDDDSAEWKRNGNNSNYQYCYKKKGFDSSDYWSSTTGASNTSNVWGVHFYNGRCHYYKSHNRCVRCVRSGQ